jgi:threonine/homoserine/homoserine lactone efflux protein
LEPLLVGLSLGLGAGLAPGPLLALVVGATLERGFAAGARLAAAPLITDAPIIALCVLVLNGLSDDVLAALSLGGAVFVAWMAFDVLRPHPPGVAPQADLKRAAITNALSPHPWLFWIAVGGPLLVDDGAAAGIAFLVAFYAMLVGAKVAVAWIVERGRRRGPSRFLPRSVAARIATNSTVERFGGARIASAILLAAASLALLLDAISRL